MRDQIQDLNLAIVLAGVSNALVGYSCTLEAGSQQDLFFNKIISTLREASDQLRDGKEKSESVKKSPAKKVK